MGLRSYNLCPVVGESPIDCLGVKVNMWHGFNQDSVNINESHCSACILLEELSI